MMLRVDQGKLVGALLVVGIRGRGLNSRGLDSGWCGAREADYRFGWEKRRINCSWMTGTSAGGKGAWNE